MKKPNLAKLVDSMMASSPNPVSIISEKSGQEPKGSPKTTAPNMADKLEFYRQKVSGTNIDTRTLLSTDYFNAFNSIVMVLDMLPDAPELLEEIEQWHFVDYVEHFKTSDLDFAALAIEAYPFAPEELRLAFEKKVSAIRQILEELPAILRPLIEHGEKGVFAEKTKTIAAQLRTLMEEGNGIVHGSSAAVQADVDKLF